MVEPNIIPFPSAARVESVPEKKAKTKPKRPKVTVEIGTDPETGKRIRKPFYGKTKKEAGEKKKLWLAEQERLKAEERERAETGATRADREQPLSKWIDTWLLAYNTKGNYSVNSTTEQGAERLKSLLGGMRLCDIRQIHIQQYAVSISDRSKSGVSKFKSTANRIFKTAVTNRLIPMNPCEDVKWPHSGEGTHRYLAEWEIHAIIKHAHAYRAGIWAMLMLFAGLRRGEALALRWDDVDFENNMIHVTKALHFELNKSVIGDPKTPASVRDIPLLPPLKTALQNTERLGEYICTGAQGQLVTDSIWSAGWRAYMNLMTKLLSAKSEEAITTKSRKGTGRAKEKPVYDVVFSIRSHDLRHTYASMLYDAGVDVKTAQKLLGHTNPEITMRIYTHLSEAKRTLSIDKMISYVTELASKVDPHLSPKVTKTPKKAAKNRENALQTRNNPEDS